MGLASRSEHGYSIQNTAVEGPRSQGRPGGLREASGAPVCDRYLPRLHPEAQGEVIRVSRARRQADPRPRRANSDQVAGGPTRLYRRLDLSEVERAPPSHRPRRPGPEAISLSSPMARGPRRVEVWADDGVRRRAPDDPQEDRRRPLEAGPPPREGARGGREAPRNDLDPGRQRGICADQQVVRPDDDA